MSSYLILYASTAALAMILGFVGLGVNPAARVEYAFQRTPEEDATIAFTTIAFIILMCSTIILAMMNCAFKEMYRILLVVNLALCGCSLLSYIIAVATFYGSVRPLSGAWILSAFWTTTVALALGVAIIYDRQDTD